ncbi:MAG TPA: ester cyclase [Rubrobacter sp.]|nr:ester cyclase [Rubrobacter sp.]
MSEVNQAVIERFYNEMWNEWNFAVAEEIVAPNVRFRGSLGSTLEGLDDFKVYIETVRAAFPDWHNRIDELVVSGDRVVTRMTWSGTHLGELLGVEPTGERVEYVGAGIFRLAHGKIEDGWVVGDTQELWKQLGRL